MKNKTLTIVFFALVITILTMLSVFFWLKNAGNEDKISDLREENEKLKDDYLTLDANLVSLNDLNVILSKELEMFRNPDNRTFFLNGVNPLAKEAKAILIWNKKDKSIIFSSEGLPKVSDKTNYQLWALNNGKYLPVAILPRILSNGFVKLEGKSEQAEGFIITLEESGKNISSTPSETYLSGNL